MSIQALQMKLQTLRTRGQRLSEELNKINIEMVKTEGVLEYLQGQAKPVEEPDTDQEKANEG